MDSVHCSITKAISNRKSAMLHIDTPFLFVNRGKKTVYNTIATASQVSNIEHLFC